VTRIDRDTIDMLRGNGLEIDRPEDPTEVPVICAALGLVDGGFGRFLVDCYFKQILGAELS
jgi:hypothetical protein